MSRIANNPVPVPDGVEVTLSDREIRVNGKHGELVLLLSPGIAVLRDEGVLKVSTDSKQRSQRAMSGTVRTLISNMVMGVTERWTKRLGLQGVGYRAQAQGRVLVLQLGYSHPIHYQLPKDIEASTPAQNQIVLEGIDRQRVGQVAAEIRSLRPPEPYKGKGIRYEGEYVRRKEGKKS